MRKLFVPLFTGALFSFTTPAFATCDPSLPADALVDCRASEVASSYHCGGAGTVPCTQLDVGTDPSQYAAEVDAASQKMKQNLAICCSGSNPTKCGGSAYPGPAAPTNSSPYCGAVYTQAFGQWTGDSASNSLGACRAYKKDCQTKADTLALKLYGLCQSGSAAPPATFAERFDASSAAPAGPSTCADARAKVKALKDECMKTSDEDTVRGAAAKGYNDAASAKETADKTDAGGKVACGGPSPGAGSGPTAGDDKNPGGGGKNPGGGDGGGPKDGSPTKSASNKGSGMNPAALMSALGPILSKLAQDQQQDPNANTPQPMATTPCGPGIVNGGQPCPTTAAAAASDSFNKNTGTSSFQTASAKNSGFNPGDSAATAGTGNRNLAPVDASQQQGLGATQVPGGSPMTGGGGGASASLGGGGGGGAVPAGGTHLPDVGLTSHSGYSAQNQAMSTAAGGSGGFSGYGKGADGEQPINYADWLPKGKNDPTRTIAGANMRPMQIQSKEVNIWNRISDHIKSRCSLGLLRDCVP